MEKKSIPVQNPEERVTEGLPHLMPVGELTAIEQIEDENFDTIAIIEKDSTGQLWINHPYSGSITPAKDYASAVDQIWESEAWYREYVDENSVQFLLDQGEEINPDGRLAQTYYDMERDGRLK